MGCWAPQPISLRMTGDSRSTVVHLLWSGRVGGIERLVYDLSVEQLRAGLPVTVAFGQMDGTFADRLSETGVPVVDLAVRSGYDLAPKRLTKSVELLRSYDLIHLHGFNLPLGTMVRRARRPVIFTEHGNFGVGRRIGMVGGLKRQLQRQFLRSSVSAVTAYSAPAALEMSELYGIPLSAIAVVTNGVQFVDLDYRVRGDQAGSDVLRVAFVGRLVASKRVDRLLEAIALMSRQDRLEVWIVGTGPLGDELRARCRSLGINDRVHFLGFRPDTHELAANVDVMVQPGQGEQLGMAMIEGIGYGALPIVFPDGKGPTLYPSDGLVVRSIAQLSAALDDLEADRLTPLARERRALWARRHFGIKTTAIAYGELYERIYGGLPDE